MKIKYKINRQTIDKFMEKYHFYFICPELKTMLLALADKPKEKCQHRWKNSRWGNEEFCVKCFAYKPNSLKTKPEIEKIEDKIRRILMLNFREYVEERIKSAHLKWNKEMREKVVSIIGAVKLGIISKEKGYDHLLSELNTLEVKEEE